MLLPPPGKAFLSASGGADGGGPCGQKLRPAGLLVGAGLPLLAAPVAPDGHRCLHRGPGARALGHALRHVVLPGGEVGEAPCSQLCTTDTEGLSTSRCPRL